LGVVGQGKSGTFRARRCRRKYAVWLSNAEVKDRVTLALRLEGIVVTISVMGLKFFGAFADFKGSDCKRVKSRSTR
jgi:hypothetical protein